MNLIWDVFIRRSKIGFIDVFFLNFIYIGFFFVMRIFVLKKKLLLEHAAKAVYRNEGYNFCIKKIVIRTCC